MIDPLATLDDLSLRGADIDTDPGKASAMLDAASAAIRDAAGSLISLAESTITLVGDTDEYLTLPGVVRSVDTVTLDGDAITDWTLAGNQLWRCGGWQPCRYGTSRNQPSTISVTYTHGFDEVPADIVDLCCDLAYAGMLSSGPSDPRLASAAVDDARFTYNTGEDASASVFELPERTKQMLRRRFSSQALVTGSQK